MCMKMLCNLFMTLFCNLNLLAPFITKHIESVNLVNATTTILVGSF